MLKFRYSAILFFAVVFAGSLQARKYYKHTRKVPQWVMEAASREYRDGESGHAYHILENFLRVEVTEKGEQVELRRFAVRVLDRGGFSAVRSATNYFEDTDTVKSLQAWVVQPEGTCVFFREEDVVDRTRSGSGQLANSARQKTINARSEVKIGSVFAFESLVVLRNVSPEIDFSFQSDLPSLRSRLEIKTPPGWQLDGLFYNTPRLEPSLEDGFQVWEKRDVAELRWEQMAPRFQDLIERVVFTWRPPPGEKLEGKDLHLYDSWEALAAHYAMEYAKLSQSSEAIREKVEDLQQDGSLWQRIQPFATFAQSVSYASLDLELGAGGGYIPRTADEVLRSNWGDCKDKSNLLVALLHVQGIESYPLIVNSAERDTIYPEHTSGSQFNHCILAIAVDESVDALSQIEHPKLGRLLLFDPTAESVSLGDLPQSVQGSKGVLLSEDAGGLIDLPVIKGEGSVTRRHLHGRLDSAGNLQGELNERSRGSMAVREQWVYRSADNLEDYRTNLQGWLRLSVPSSSVSEVEVNYERESGIFECEFSIGADRFAKSVGAELLLVPAYPFAQTRRPDFLDEEKRTQDLILSYEHLQETTELELPTGYRADRLPDPLELNESFGSYYASVEVNDGLLKARRSIQLEEKPIPAEDFQRVVAFYEQILAYERASVALEREAED